MTMSDSATICPEPTRCGGCGDEVPTEELFWNESENKWLCEGCDTWHKVWEKIGNINEERDS